MTAKASSFDSGVSGSVPAITDAGTPDKWDSVASSGTTLAYSTTAAHGGIGMKAQPTAAVSIYAAWTTLGALTEHYGRAYLNITFTATANLHPIRCMSGGVAGTVSWRIQPDSVVDGGINIRNGADTVTLAAGTFPYPLNTWFRVEWHAIESLTAASVVVRLYASADSTTISETISTASFAGAVASIDTVRFGHQNNQAVFFDDVMAGQVGWPGPFVAPQPPILRPLLMRLGR